MYKPDINARYKNYNQLLNETGLRMLSEEALKLDTSFSSSRTHLFWHNVPNLF